LHGISSIFIEQRVSWEEIEDVKRGLLELENAIFATKVLAMGTKSIEGC
jgi:hypothetical protein